jgi:hypothetical protein
MRLSKSCGAAWKNRLVVQKTKRTLARDCRFPEKSWPSIAACTVADSGSRPLSVVVVVWDDCGESTPPNLAFSGALVHLGEKDL